MKYYFPITINSRRAHVCELSCNDDQKCVFEFLIDSESKNLLEIKSKEQLFFSSEGSNQNLAYNKLKCEVSESPDGERFDIDFYRDAQKEQEDAPKRKGNIKTSCFVVSKAEDDSICFNIDRDKLDKNKTYTICIHLNKGDKDYCYKFKIHYCKSKSQIKTAALDFGSEATQVRMSGDSYLPILDKMKDFYVITDSKMKFWQEDENKNLYKSIFFLNTNECVLDNGQKPHKYGDDEFVQALVQRVQNDKLKIIPNLKLADMIDGGWANDIRINIKEDHVRGYAIQNNGSPNNVSYRKLILRNVLNYFLHCILKGFEFPGCRINDCSVVTCNDKLQCTQPIYLKLIILMPNVYSQEKVYDIMSGLYEDFNTMKKDYPAFEGIEVVCISESDAAFLGVANDGHWIGKFEKKENSYSLIIDAGKGTTDFSILQQQRDGTKYKSLYKNGLPISGNYLTYAFYEAASEYLKSANINLSQYLQDACRNNPSDVIDFMDILENFKKKYDDSKEEVPLLILGETDIVNSQGNCNEMLKKINLEEKLLPGLKSFVNKRMDVIVKKTIENIKKIMPDNKSFLNVIFTGRGFLFKPFAQMMKDELVKEGLLPQNKEILQYSDAAAKHICVKGAFNLAQTASINENSELICIPVMPKSSNKLLNLFSHVANLLADETFLFEGMEVSKADRVGIGNTDYRIDQPDLNPVLIFTGKGFLLQYENESKAPAPYDRGRSDADRLEDASEETRISLFPFFKGSIRTENIQESQASSERQTNQSSNSDSNSDQKTEQETEQNTDFD